MKRVLILCLHRPERSPSQRFRFEQQLPYLEKHGYTFDFSYLLNAEDDKVYYQPGNYFAKLKIVLKSVLKRTWELVNIRKYDLIFVQREAFMLGTAFFEKAMAAKVPMIFDFDDAIWVQSNISEANKKLAFLKDASKTAKNIASASLVFAGNPYLAEYARKFNKNVVIVPVTIDTDYYMSAIKKQPGRRLCIGWSGSFSTVEHFATAIPALKRIKDKYGDKVYFKIIGDGNYYCKELETQGIPWRAATEAEDLAEFDIGIMPLPDNEWTRGKCGLKGLQYMAFGTPTLMSPVGVNNDIIRHGVNGFLPATEEEWVEQLSMLIEDEALRERIGEAGKRTVLNEYSNDAWYEKYRAYFDELTAGKTEKKVDPAYKTT